MPTAAKLVAALSFAFLAWVVCIVVEGVLPANERVGNLYPVSMVCGALAGWFVSGAAKRAKYHEAASTGIRTVATALILALGTFSVATMLQIALRGRYRGPMEALLDIVHQFLGFGTVLLSTSVIVALFLGGAIAGMITEYTGRRWR